MKKRNKKDNIEKILRQILTNQRNIMIWISSESKPYHVGYFSENIEDTEELLK